MNNRPKHSASLVNQNQTTSPLANQVKSPVTLTGRSRNTASLTNRSVHGHLDTLLATEALDYLVCEDNSYILISSVGAVVNKPKHAAV